jgi:4-amino-4-deoxy-L-arabinose transferase-like glycosyltransferase
LTDSSASEDLRFTLGAVAIVALGAAVRWAFFDVTDFRGDELVYVRYAEAIRNGGLAQFKTLAAQYAADPSAWAYPPPLRVLYIMVTGLACSLASDCSGAIVAGLSLLSGIALVAVTLLMARRLLGPHFALLAGLLVAVAPLQLQLSRRALQDGFFSLTVLVALWAFWERSRSERKAWDALLGSALLAAVLTKESSVILTLFFLAALLYPVWLTSAPVPFSHSTLGAIVLPLPAAAVIIYGLIPDLSLLARVLGGWLAAAERAPYAVAYSSGYWFRYLVDFLLLSPVVAILAIGRDFVPEREIGRRFIERTTLVLFVAFSMLSLKNIRYVSFLDVPIRMLAVMSLGALLHRVELGGTRGVALAAATIVVALYDLVLFHAVFIRSGVYDPVTANLARAARLIP